MHGVGIGIGIRQRPWYASKGISPNFESLEHGVSSCAGPVWTIPTTRWTPVKSFEASALWSKSDTNEIWHRKSIVTTKTAGARWMIDRISRPGRFDTWTPRWPFLMFLFPPTCGMIISLEYMIRVIPHAQDRKGIPQGLYPFQVGKKVKRHMPNVARLRHHSSLSIPTPTAGAPPSLIDESRPRSWALPLVDFWTADKWKSGLSCKH